MQSNYEIDINKAKSKSNNKNQYDIVISLKPMISDKLKHITLADIHKILVSDKVINISFDTFKKYLYSKTKPTNKQKVDFDTYTDDELKLLLVDLYKIFKLRNINIGSALSKAKEELAIIESN